MNTPTLMEKESQQVLSKLQDTVNGDPNNYPSLIEAERMEGTPFTIITATDKGKEAPDGSFIAMGNQRMSELNTYEECVKLVKERDWVLITALAIEMAERVIKFKNNKNQE